MGEVDRRRVALVSAGDDRVEERAVADGARDRADLVEARGERDDAVAGDGSVRRAQADVGAERGGLLDRAAGVGAERPRSEPGADGRGRAAADAAGHAGGLPRVVRRAEGRVLGQGAHCELVGVRLAEDAEPMAFQPLDHRRVVDGNVALEDLRACRRRDPLRPDHVLDRDREAVAAGVVADVEVAMKLLVAVVDRGAVGGEQFGSRDLARLEEALCLFGCEPERVDHVAPPGGTLKKSPSRSGALASASSTGRQARGSSSPPTLTTSRGGGGGGTAERSSSDTFETASRMSLSWPSSRSTSSSRSSSRARCATWRSCSRSIAISFDPPKKKRAPAGALSTIGPQVL